MKEIKPEHYVDTIIYSVDMIIKNLKNELKQKVDKLGLGITGEQFVVLDTIFCNENMYQQKLSDILMKDKSNTTRILKVLMKKDLITRTAGNVNNRLVYMLNITDKGKALVKTNMPKIKKFIADIFQNITDEEIDILHSMSKKFQSDLESSKVN
ncbi:MAG: MarR family transcriptional regulator [Candidatus Gastranaerophilaceae bacterium]|jgi:DNA-binding MarR family transcriptional regulator|nr:MarR family transcriptional regulator [Candidatus Gastranaerophilaceae bacterium]